MTRSARMGRRHHPQPSAVTEHDPHCPACRHLLDAATLTPDSGTDAPIGEALPHARAGSFCLCIGCGALLRFEGEPGVAWRYRIAQMGEARRAGGASLVRRIARVQRALGVVKRYPWGRN